MSASPQTFPAAPQAEATGIYILLHIADLKDDAPAVLEKILWDRLAAVRACLLTLLRTRESNSLSDAIATAYTALPTARQARVLLSSEFSECYGELDRIHLSGQCLPCTDPEVASLYARLLDIVLREQSIDELASGRVSPYLKRSRSYVIWSPMGDVSAVRDGWGHWEILAQPTIGDVIALDSDSLVALNNEPTSGTMSYPPLEFTTSERADVITKLQTALAIIDELCPAYGIMIRNFVRRIIIRKSLDASGVDDAAKKGFSIHSSEHAPRQAGSIRILNPHLDECTIVGCVEKLLHESTHNVLAAWEFANGSFIVNDKKYRPVSPWSGNPIPNSSFVHATFVYYMCHRLFVEFSKSDYAKEPLYARAIQSKLATFAAGFLGEYSIYDQLLVVESPVHDVRGILDTMQSKMKTYYSSRQHITTGLTS